MSRTFSHLLLATLLAGFLAPVPNARGATPDEIERSINKGKEYLKQIVVDSFKSQGEAVNCTPGEVALAGLALLESGVSAEDESIKRIAARVREASYSQHRTYNVALCLLFLDRLGKSADVPLIQLLGVRLAVGQRPQGGWSYICIVEPTAAAVQQLKNRLRVDELTTLPPGTVKLHPDVERYALGLRRAPTERSAEDAIGVQEDNSNTQFATNGLWAARRHGLNVENNLAAVERRFLASQLPNGGWGYHVGGPAGPSMTCAGLLAIATGIARRDDKGKEAPKAPPPSDGREAAARRGLIALASTLGHLRGQSLTGQAGLGNGDLYYFWSLERVCVIYNLEQLAGVDWHAVGADTLVRAQNRDGSWEYRSFPAAGTALALLFLNKANLTKDLQAVKREQFSELRSADVPRMEKTPATPVVPPKGVVTKPSPTLPTPKVEQAALVAADLLKASDAEWPIVLAKLRDEKGPTFTRALVLAANKVEGNRKKDVRGALADRLTRMTAATLREMLGSDEAELRRAAVLACAMKDDAAHIPDLIDRVRDDSPIVWPAVRAALKSLTGQDFGPPTNSTPDDRRRAAEAWKAWYSQKKSSP